MREKKYIGLEARIIAKGLTNRAMAKEIGISESSLFKKRTGESDFTLEELKKIKEMFSLSEREFDEIFLR